MRQFKSLNSLKLPSKNGTPRAFVLRNAPGILEIEEMLAVPGIDWTPKFEKRFDEVSLAVFGVTAADTRPKEPHPDQVKDDGPLSRWRFSDDALAQYEQMLATWHDWQRTIGGIEAAIRTAGATQYWKSRRIDITDGNGIPLDCYRRFERQLVAAHMNLLPGARITADGTGKRAAQSVEDWAAALEAAAAQFRPSR